MEQSKSYGAVVASIIVILVLIVGALYFWGRTLETKEVAPAQQTSEASATVTSDVQTATDTNDSVESLKADINATSDLKDVEAGLKQI